MQTRRAPRAIERWHIALCAGCALASLRDRLREKAINAFLTGPLLIILGVIVGGVVLWAGVANPLRELSSIPAVIVIGCALLVLFGLFKTVLGLPIGVLILRKRRGTVAGHALAWTDEERWMALRNEAGRIVDALRSGDTSLDLPFPLPSIPTGRQEPPRGRVEYALIEPDRHIEIPHEASQPNVPPQSAESRSNHEEQEGK
jgi:hypothetical protein